MPSAGAPAGERHIPKTMREAKVRAVLMDLEEDPSLARALLVFLGCFFLLMGFPFYGPIASIIIAALAAVLAYKSAPLGTIAMVVVAFPAIAYQSPLFAWLFILVISVTLFEAFEHWAKIAMLAVLIMAPFAAAPFGFLGGIVIPTMTLAALYAGSRMSLRISLPAVFFILLLTTLWGGQNSAFMPVKDPAGAYGPLDPFLAHDRRPAVELTKIPGEIPAAVGSILSPKAIEGLNPAINRVLVNTYGLLFADSALIQLLTWGFTLFMVAFLPARIKGANAQLLSSLSLVVVIAGYYLASGISGQSFNPFILAYVGATVCMVAVLERGHIKVSREMAVLKADRTSKFGKFGLEDLSTSAGVESLANVGGYEELKDELTETIVWPVQRKELAVAYGIKPPKGILLFGPPGTGKTLIMRALAKELDVGFYYVKCSELLSQWYGESEKNISELFTIARKNAPCILFFDEIYSI